MKRLIPPALFFCATSPIPFIATEVAEKDVCLAAVRGLSSAFKEITASTHAQKPQDTAPAISGGKENLNSDQEQVKPKENWIVRLAVTDFLMIGASHLSLEFLPVGGVGRLWQDGHGYQVHGTIVRKDTGKGSGITPCSVSKIYAQASGNHRLVGIITQKDKNVPLIGAYPSDYMTLVTGSRVEVKDVLERVRQAVRRFNERQETYGFWQAPNSNSFIQYVVEEAGIDFPSGDLASSPVDYLLTNARHWVPGVSYSHPAHAF